MKFSEKWLLEWVQLPKTPTETLLQQLTMAGLEVAGCTEGVEFSDVIVGEIIKLEPHPNADKLKIALVDIGVDEPLKIVCGATNTKVGLKTATALVGAKLPGGFKIKKSKLRGVESSGMLCSSKELGLDDDAEGIMELPQELTTGQDLIQAFDLNDKQIEIDLTPNRGDCLSILGIAREVAAINQVPLNKIDIPNIPITSEKIINIEVQNPKACPVFLGRVIDNINPNAKTPIWMQEKLRRSGIRSLGPLVDVTNFVMIELGQPMHAYDLAKIDHKIIARNSKANESLTLLDGNKIQLDEGTLVIADINKTLGIAGVMGGLDSGISQNTNALFLECACFDQISLAGVARKYNMQTEASHRYERGVDYKLQNLAINRASELLLNIVGGNCGQIVEVNNVSKSQPSISLTIHDVKTLLGADISATTISNILSNLGMNVTQISPESWQVIPPSYRSDIVIAADLIEEIGRIYGYDNIEIIQPALALNLAQSNESVRNINEIKQLLVNRDYQETINYSFVNPKLQSILGVDIGTETLINPISLDLSQMRTSLWSSLIATTIRNLNRKHKRIRLFETGLRFFIDQSNQLQQIPTLAGIACGNRFSSNWNEQDQAVDLFDIKQDIECLFKLPLEFVDGSHPSLHPKQTIKINYQQQTVGIMGKIHPEIAQKLEISENTFLFELDLEQVIRTTVTQYTEISKYPEISRDLAFVVDSKLASSDLINCILSLKGNNIKSAHVFDVYMGENIANGKQSLSVNIKLQANDRTLTEGEIESSMETIIAKLSASFATTVRE